MQLADFQSLVHAGYRLFFKNMPDTGYPAYYPALAGLLDFAGLFVGFPDRCLFISNKDMSYLRMTIYPKPIG